MNPPYAITVEDVRDAALRIKDHIHHTPVLTCSTISRLTDGLNLFFKAELFQRSGSFKLRGAANAIFSLPEEEASKGVVTHSSGNHAAAVALAAKMRGVPSYIVVPVNTPKIKTAAVQAYGGNLYFCEPTMDAREAECSRLQLQTGAAFVHPYNDAKVMAGQGTIALEFLEQVPLLDAIVVPVSGCGMISGIATAAKAIKPSIKVIAAEPAGTNNAADVAESKAAGQLLMPGKPLTIADGLQGRMGSNTWPIVRDLVDGVVTVSEEQIVAAMRLLFIHAKVVVEPSGAVGLAAVLKATGESNAGTSVLSGCRAVGMVLCGGNVDLDSKGLFEMSSWRPA